jgi:RNA polymerase sigma factor (sigma-70 family)
MRSVSVPVPVASDVLAARRGDADAFGRLVRGHASLVCAVTTAALGDPAAGEDVAQEVFVEAWQALPRLRDPARFSGWLRQIARHRASNARRSRGRRREVGSDDVLGAVRDPGPDPGDRLDRVRREAALWRSLEALDRDVGEVLVLFYREGRSVREVAERLDLTEQAVRKRLSRARERLRDEVTEALGSRLARTAPGAAFAVAVGAAVALAPGRAEAATGRSPRWGLAAAAAIGLVAGGLSTVASPVVAGLHGTDAVGPRPAETRAAMRRSAPRPPVPTAPVSSEAPDGTVLRVRLGTWRSPDGASFSIVPFRPGTFWPTLEEAPFPRGRRVAALVDFVAERTHEVPARLMVKIAPLRTDTLPADPWGGLVALEVERLHAEQAWRDALAAGEEASLAARDHGGVLVLAREARARWPDHPVADFAALYEIEALGNAGEEHRDELTDLAMDLVEQSSDPYVIDAAITRLSSGATAPDLGPDDLDLLQAHYDDPEAEMNRFALASVGVESALALGDFRRASSWMARHDAQTAEALLQIHAADAGRIGDERDLRSGWLAARGAAPPVNWRSALYAEVQRCAEGVSAPAEVRTGEGRYDGGWRWTWSVDYDELTACIDAASPDGPPPPAGTEATLEVLPPK